jgi:hypothetical protein
MRASIVRSTLIAAVGTLLVASSVLAARPGREALEGFDDFVLEAGSGNCAFDVNVHLDVNREIATFWDTPDSSTVIVTGAFKLTLTNLSTGASLPVNASSSGHLEFDADGNLTKFTVTGLTIGFNPLILYAGQVDAITGGVYGTSTDLCAALSS